ncbi:MAG: RNA polymerase factor sigma-54 [Thiomonas sp.]
MKPSLNLRLSQHLALTPQLQQSIRLLQLSTLELTQEIEGLLESNPFLENEETDDGTAAAPTAEQSAPLQPDLPTPLANEGHESAAEFATEPAAELQLETQDWTASSGETDHGADTDADADSWVSSGQSSGGGDDDEFSAIDRASEHLGLRDHLRSQLAGLALSATDRAAAEAIIDSLDDNGYLPETMLELAQALAPEAGEDQLQDLADALTTAMRLIQSFDPPGVAAHDLPECLCLQLQRQPPCPVRDMALQICRDGHLDLLARRDWRKLERQLGADEAMLRLAQQRIAQLEPHPGGAFRSDAAQAVTPDVIARKTARGWTAQLNPEVMPRLRVNQIYADALRRARDSGTAMQGQLQEARWFVKNVQQRFETIERVAQTIVERQQRFFDFGPVAMRPMVLREIADELGLHESTISRVTTQKFMLTPFGTVELKYFFGSGLSTEAGGNTSSTAVRELIRRLVSEEDSTKPLSDSELAERLTQQGVQVARRTVAKYREALRIAPANLRKSG